jgi:hypothetical protein
VAILAAASALFAQLSAPAVEEAAESGRRAAEALLHGHRAVFESALAVDSIAGDFLGASIWNGLSERQRDRIRSVIRDHFVEMLEPPRAASAEVAWSAGRPEGDGVALFLGLRYPAGVLKTRWSLTRTAGGWMVGDVFLTDPGISIASDAVRSIGRGAIRRRDPAREARTAVLPRALGLTAILVIVLVVSRRLPAPGRRILFLTAAAPAILFLVDGALAVRRALSESYSVPEVLPPAPWSGEEREALRAQREGRLDDASRAWERAVAAGAPAAPADYQLGLALAAAGRKEEAKAAFLRALTRSPSAPGASKELGVLALAQGNSAEARGRLERYIREAGPDPDSLSALAVAEANVGESARAVESVEQARVLMADRWKGVRLQSQVYARAGNASKTVEMLRTLESEGGLDRESLRSDPAYLPIATDPAWVAFLSETPVAVRTPAR